MTDGDTTRLIIADYYKVHRSEVTGYVNRCVHRPDVSEDIIQDTFVRLLCSDYLITKSTLPALVHKIARNLIIDYWRRHARTERYEHRMTCRTGETNGLDTAYVYGCNEIMRLLEQGTARLSESRRTIYRLNIYEGMQVADIARTMNIGYKTAEKRLGTARKEVRTYVRRMLA